MKDKRKILVIILILFVIICILGYIFIKITCPNIRAVVVKPAEKYLTVMDIKDEGLYIIFLPDDINLQFKQGQEIVINCKYGTIIEQSLPASIREQYIEKIKIIKEKSNVEIPNKILSRVYNSGDKILISVDELSTTGISLTIKDTNEYKREYEYSNDYKIVKKNSRDTYNALTENTNSKKIVDSIKVDNDTFKNTYNWENVYGNLESGEYRFKISTVDYYINIFMYFTIDENGKITYSKAECGLLF